MRLLTVRERTGNLRAGGDCHLEGQKVVNVVPFGKPQEGNMARIVGKGTRNQNGDMKQGKAIELRKEKKTN